MTEFQRIQWRIPGDRERWEMVSGQHAALLETVWESGRPGLLVEKDMTSGLMVPSHMVMVRSGVWEKKSEVTCQDPV